MLNQNLSSQFQKDFFFKKDGPLFSESNFKKIQSYFLNLAESVPEPQRYLNFANDIRFRPAIADWVDRRELMDVVQPILGEDLVFWSIGVCYKPPMSDYQVGWHIDSHFWMRNEVLFPPDALILFFSLTEMTEENGGLEIIPHLNDPKYYEHVKRDKDHFFFEHEISEKEFGGRKPHLIQMKENELCGFASHVPHRSGPNRSTKPRIGITLRYLQSSVKITDTPLDGRESYLISGVDRAGNSYSQIQARGSIGGLT
ncbi:phytanoyl-CoA dioxygenase family protein [Pseudobdellovibrio exovorus]|uniref:Phytanoyl-CoA dioxygenase n=1 Tax=Pseudobdellovibrio exovorus JSS TaxID=1184267 RepID=M4VU73_9BACT|nr:phytanoyl-CoA dioxygenase family protein [Pseudobdellovibrio exovorus]AGH96764.1 hypothetical protein A11Q_2548 [Pseudobdellovibrio exovorus JSS]